MPLPLSATQPLRGAFARTLPKFNIGPLEPTGTTGRRTIGPLFAQPVSSAVSLCCRSGPQIAETHGTGCEYFQRIFLPSGEAPSLSDVLGPTDRETAFAALLPIAAAVHDALARVDQRVTTDRTHNGPLRNDFHASQHASLDGSFRFSAAVAELKRALDPRDDVQRVSTLSQEAQNIYLWLVADVLLVRVKHDLSDVLNPGASQLFSSAGATGVQTAFITWDLAPDGTMRTVLFANVEEPKWTISLSQLLSVTSAPDATIAPKRPAGPVVRSTKPSRASEEESG